MRPGGLGETGSGLVLAGIRWGCWAVFAITAVGLLLIDLIEWRRTAELRRGRSPGPPVSRGTVRSRASPTTWLAATGGFAVAGAGLVTLGRARAAGGGLAAAGLFIAVAGFRARVAELEAGPAGLVVSYAGRAPFILPWVECRELRPPRSPLDGWQVVGTRASRSLMPTDIRGNEWFLQAVVDRAGLSFRSGAWVKNPTESLSARPTSVSQGG